jgi:hypothetical protein
MIQDILRQTPQPWPESVGCHRPSLGSQSQAFSTTIFFALTKITINPLTAEASKPENRLEFRTGNWIDTSLESIRLRDPWYDTCERRALKGQGEKL